MRAPMLLMGLMALYAGLVLAVAASGSADPGVARSLKAWVQVPSSWVRASCCRASRYSWAPCWEQSGRPAATSSRAFGVEVKTLLMPLTARLFLAMMMAGLMVEIAQFFFYACVYACVASLTDSASVAAFNAWLAPFREFGLGLLLSGVVLALATIARALDFQFSRIRELITGGR